MLAERVNPLQCPRCAYKLDDPLYCSKCGFSLKEDDKDQTVIYSLDDRPGNLVLSGWGKSVVKEKTKLVIHVDQATEPLIIEPKEQLNIGRSDGSKNVAPDLDLAPYGAVDKGVSRVHAAFKTDGNSISIVDLGSTNGTFLNEEHVPPNNAHILRDGDAVRLGKLVFHVYFKQ